MTLLLLAGMLLTVPGCSKPKPKVPVGKVKGSITIDGEPVVDGCRVQFASKTGVLVGLAVVKAGDYVLLNAGAPEIPTAEYAIQILPPEQSKAEEDEERKQKKIFLLQAAANLRERKPIPEIPRSTQEDHIPAKYWHSETSGLKFTVEEGDNTADFQLTKKNKQN